MGSNDQAKPQAQKLHRSIYVLINIMPWQTSAFKLFAFFVGQLYFRIDHSSGLYFGRRIKSGLNTKEYAALHVLGNKLDLQSRD